MAPSPTFIPKHDRMADQLPQFTTTPIRYEYELAKDGKSATLGQGAIIEALGAAERLRDIGADDFRRELDNLNYPLVALRCGVLAPLHHIIISLPPDLAHRFNMPDQRVLSYADAVAEYVACAMGTSVGGNMGQQTFPWLRQITILPPAGGTYSFRPVRLSFVDEPDASGGGTHGLARRVLRCVTGELDGSALGNRILGDLRQWQAAQTPQKSFHIHIGDEIDRHSIDDLMSRMPIPTNTRILSISLLPTSKEVTMDGHGHMHDLSRSGRRFKMECLMNWLCRDGITGCLVQFVGGITYRTFEGDWESGDQGVQDKTFSHLVDPLVASSLLEKCTGDYPSLEQAAEACVEPRTTYITFRPICRRLACAHCGAALSEVNLLDNNCCERPEQAAPRVHKVKVWKVNAAGFRALFKNR